MQNAIDSNMFLQSAPTADMAAVAHPEVSAQNTCLSILTAEDVAWLLDSRLLSEEVRHRLYEHLYGVQSRDAFHDEGPVDVDNMPVMVSRSEVATGGTDLQPGVHSATCRAGHFNSEIPQLGPNNIHSTRPKDGPPTGTAVPRTRTSGSDSTLLPLHSHRRCGQGPISAGMQDRRHRLDRAERMNSPLFSRQQLQALLPNLLPNAKILLNELSNQFHVHTAQEQQLKQLSCYASCVEHNLVQAEKERERLLHIARKQQAALLASTAHMERLRISNQKQRAALCDRTRRCEQMEHGLRAAVRYGKNAFGSGQ